MPRRKSFFSPWFSYPTSRPLHHGWAFPVGKSRPFCFVWIWVEVLIIPRSLNLCVRHGWFVKAQSFKPYLKSTLHIFYLWIRSFNWGLYVCRVQQRNDFECQRKGESSKSTCANQVWTDIDLYERFLTQILKMTRLILLFHPVQCLHRHPSPFWRIHLENETIIIGQMKCVKVQR